MKTYIVLFRGVNVGGHNPLPMKPLKALLERSGCADVQTYVQSGNVIVRSTRSDCPGVEKLVSAAIARNYDFEPRVFVMTARELQRAIAHNPFPEADENPKRVHLFFLAAKPKNPDLDRLEALKAVGDRFALKDRVFYLFTPGGFGNSRLGQRVERLLGVEATARNWNTVTTLLKMTEELSPSDRTRLRNPGARLQGNRK